MYSEENQTQPSSPTAMQRNETECLVSFGYLETERSAMHIIERTKTVQSSSSNFDPAKQYAFHMWMV